MRNKTTYIIFFLFVMIIGLCTLIVRRDFRQTAEINNLQEQVNCLNLGMSYVGDICAEWTVIIFQNVGNEKYTSSTHFKLDIKK